MNSWFEIAGRAADYFDKNRCFFTIYVGLREAGTKD